MRVRGSRLFAVAAFAAAALSFNSARAAQCGDSAGGFRAWPEDFKQVAINDCVPPDAADSALSTASFDPSVLAHDHGQAAFQGNYASFAAVTSLPVVSKGAGRCFWPMPSRRKDRTAVRRPCAGAGCDLGARTDFGAGLGSYPTFSALATLSLGLPPRDPLSRRIHRRFDDHAASAFCRLNKCRAHRQANSVATQRNAVGPYLKSGRSSSSRMAAAAAT